MPDVLIILDCCYAANAASYTIGGTTKELLAACGRENLTTGVGDRSFTSALIDELQAFGSNPFTVAMLHTRLVTMRWRLRFTPIYALLSKHGGDSIDLSRLPSTKRSRPPTVTEADENSMPLDDPMDLSSSDESNLSLSLHPSSRSSEPPLFETRVLLAVSIRQDAACEISQWVNWLTTKPPWEVTRIDVKVEGVYESHSTLMLVSLPIFVWDSLPCREAYRFIAFIRSGNLQQPQVNSRLAPKVLDAQPESSEALRSATDLRSQPNPGEKIASHDISSSSADAHGSKTIYSPDCSSEMEHETLEKSLKMETGLLDEKWSSILKERKTEFDLLKGRQDLQRNKLSSLLKEQDEILLEEKKEADLLDDKISSLLRELESVKRQKGLASTKFAADLDLFSNAEKNSPESFVTGPKAVESSDTNITALLGPKKPSESSADDKARSSASSRPGSGIKSEEAPVAKGPEDPKTLTTKGTHRTQPYPLTNVADLTAAPVKPQYDSCTSPPTSEDNEAEFPTTRHRRWSPEDNKRLKQARERGESFEDIARDLGRNVMACRVRYSRLMSKAKRDAFSDAEESIQSPTIPVSGLESEITSHGTKKG